MSLEFTEVIYPDFVGLLTEEERLIIQKTWTAFRTNLKSNAVDLFIRYFRENPSYQQLFESLSKLNMSELAASKRLQAHGVQVCNTITAIVESLRDPECATELLFKVAKTHVPRRISMPMYVNLGKTLIGVLVEKLGSETMGASAIEAWTKFYGAIVDVFEMLYERMGRKEEPKKATEK